MERREPIDARTLIAEIERYLAAVDVFRSHGCEPCWQPEWSLVAAPSEPSVTLLHNSRSAH